MFATYGVGALGITIGMHTMQADPASLSIATLLTVGSAGLLSFVRHSVFSSERPPSLGSVLHLRRST